MSKFIIEKFNLKVRFVEISDADFILKMRSNIKLSKHLSQTENDIAKQIEWILEYKKREYKGEEYYFIYELLNGQKLGVNRIYNITVDSFEVGSWLFDENGSSDFNPIYADIIAKEFGFENLFLKFAYFDVRIDNYKVIKYHQIFKPIIIKNDDINVYFKLERTSFNKNKNIILNVINNGSK